MMRAFPPAEKAFALMHASSEDRLVDLIYGALLGETSWQQFVDEVGRGVPDARSTMFFHDPARHQGTLAVTSGVDARDVELYNAEYSAIDAWVPKATTWPVGLGCIMEQMYPREELLRTRFHAEWLRSLRVETGTGVAIERADGRLFLLSVLTPRADPDVNMEHAKLLTRLAPHLARAKRAYRDGPALALRGEATHLALDGLGVSALLIDGEMRIRRASAQAQRLLVAGWGVDTTPTGALRIADATITAAMRTLLAWVPGGPRSYSGRFVHAGQSLRVVIVRIASDALSLYFQGPTAVVLIDAYPGHVDPLSRNLANLASIAQLYRLTPIEAEVLGGIVGGASIDRLAELRGVSRETIRTQLRAVYAKTGCSRQADLVRLVLGAVSS